MTDILSSSIVAPPIIHPRAFEMALLQKCVSVIDYKAITRIIRLLKVKVCRFPSLNILLSGISNCEF